MASTPIVVEIELRDLEDKPPSDQPPPEYDNGGPSAIWHSHADPRPPVAPAPVVVHGPPRAMPDPVPAPARAPIPAPIGEKPEQSMRIKNVIFAILSVVSFSHAWDSTCICVALPVSSLCLAP